MVLVSHHGKKKRALGLFYLSLLVGDDFKISSTSAFVSPSRHRRLTSSAASPPFSATRNAFQQGTDELQQRLESMTVKELREVLKNSELNQRGILSKLKLKSDLVDFLKNNLHTSADSCLRSEELPNHAILENTKKTITVNGSKGKSSASSTSSSKVPVGMPKVTSTIETVNRKPWASPKDHLFEEVYLRYPPIRDQNCTDIGEDDVRQIYHPIFHQESMKASSDMDIIFVGTASCTPGITRGVSCTALRLNWKRSALYGVPQGSKSSEEATSFSGGTWLFDCGECTQVCPWLFASSAIVSAMDTETRSK